MKNNVKKYYFSHSFNSVVVCMMSSTHGIVKKWRNIMLAYTFEEVRNVFCGSVFKMNDHTGAVICELEHMYDIPHQGSDFRVGSFIFNCHEVTPKYVIGTFTLSI